MSDTQSQSLTEEERKKLVREERDREHFENAYKWRHLWVPLTGFFLLSPGLILTIPPNDGRWQGLFFSMQTNFWAIVIHTIVFAIWIILWNILFTHLRQKRLMKEQQLEGRKVKLPWEKFDLFFQNTDQLYETD